MPAQHALQHSSLNAQSDQHRMPSPRFAPRFAQIAHRTTMAPALLATAIALTVMPPRAAAAEWPAIFGQPAPAERQELPDAITALKALPASANAPALAVHVTPEGHWLFTNAAGEAFTAGTPDELKRAPSVLAPEAKDGYAAIRLVLSRDSLFAGPAVLKDLPATRSLFVALDGEAVEARRSPRNTLIVRIRPRVSAEASGKDAFLETLAQLRRPLDAARMRVLAASPGSPATLTRAPMAGAPGTPAIDAVEPDQLPASLASIPRQTAILTARIDGTNLTMQPQSGPDRTVTLAAMTSAAAASDVDLLILRADPPLQPGGRNWLWQRVQVSGLDHATRRSTFADFLDQIAANSSPLLVSATPLDATRTRLLAEPVTASLTTAEGVTGWLKDTAGALTGQVTGSVKPAAIEAYLVSAQRRTELSHRLIGDIPASAPLVYVIAALLGLLGLPIARAWWRRIWPLELRSDYGNARGFALARIIRAICFVMLFLPLAALPALAVHLIRLMSRRKAPTPGT